MTHEPHIVPTRHDLDRLNAEAALARALELLEEREREVERLRNQLLGATACAFGRVLDGEGIAHTPVSDAACRAALDLCEEANCQLRDELAVARQEIERLTLELAKRNYTPCVHCEENERLKLLLREAVLRGGLCDERWFREARAKAGGDDASNSN